MRLISSELWWIKFYMIILKHLDNRFSQFYHSRCKQCDYNNRLHSVVLIPNILYVFMDHEMLYFWGKNPQYPLVTRLDGTQIWS